MSIRVGRPKTLIAVSVLLLIIGSGLWFWNMQVNKPSPYSKLKLSNGKSVYLGQPVTEVKKVLGEEFQAGAEGVYGYPSYDNARHPLQVIFFTDKGKVVAVRVHSNPANQQTETGFHYNTKVAEVLSKGGGKVKPINEILKYGIAQGYQLKSSGMVSYYLVNTCSAKADTIAVLAVAVNGFEKKAKEPGAGCGIRS